MDIKGDQVALNQLALLHDRMVHVSIPPEALADLCAIEEARAVDQQPGNKTLILPKSHCLALGPPTDLLPERSRCLGLASGIQVDLEGHNVAYADGAWFSHRFVDVHVLVVTPIGASDHAAPPLCICLADPPHIETIWFPFHVKSILFIPRWQHILMVYNLETGCRLRQCQLALWRRQCQLALCYAPRVPRTFSTRGARPLTVPAAPLSILSIMG